jgi:dihydropyrimidinase
VHWEDLHVIADFSCWEGWELRGKVTTTVLRGSVIVENERFVGSTSGGQFVPRKLLPEIVSWPPDYRRSR